MAPIEGGAEIAAEKNSFALRFQHCTDQCRRRTFAVGAGNRDQRGVKKTKGELDLTQHRDVPRRRFFQQPMSIGTPGLGITQSTPSSQLFFFPSQVVADWQTRSNYPVPI